MRISWQTSKTRISRAGQLLAQPPQPMHLAGIENGPAAELLRHRPGPARDRAAVTRPAFRQTHRFLRVCSRTTLLQSFLIQIAIARQNQYATSARPARPAKIANGLINAIARMRGGDDRDQQHQREAP